MDFRAAFNGHGKQPGRGLVDVVPIFEGCSVFVPNPDNPPPDDDMPIAIADVLQKWMKENPIRVRETLPSLPCDFAELATERFSFACFSSSKAK